ncbi:MAG: guanylate kinase [Zetaproteobacteria bacterium]|nr:MAG: guanylate kinase [Zetaproteobacteria bacterium]
MSGRLFIVSGPSGAGKSSLCAAWLKQCPNLRLSVSTTTRAPRPGERDGREYHFVDRACFERARDAGEFLEWASVHGELYGTRARDVRALLDAGYDVLLEIDWQGAAQVAARMPEAVRIFILPPSIEELRVRLNARGQDDAATIARRVAAAEEELRHADEAHHRIVNDDFDRALAELLRIYAQEA